MNAIIVSELNYLFMQDIKPNFSELSREYGIDRHTLKKHYEAGGRKERKKRTYTSSLDQYEEIIQAKLKIKGITYMGIYKMLVDKFSYGGSYSNFKAYIKKKHYSKVKTSNKPHVRFETPAGKQLQVDWKEDLKIATKSGEIINFNLFAATLGYSRLHYFVYSETKTREAFMRCLISTLKYIGGIPKEILTDNMTAIVSIEGNRKIKHPQVIQLERDLDLPIRLCKTRSPETKGKVESSNRFVSRLLAYNGEIESKDDLVNLIDKLTKTINEEINQSTMISPITLFQKEKEQLRPLSNTAMLETYITYDATCKVPSTLLVPYKGSTYSVPAKYLDKRVKLIEDNETLYIYYSTELIRIHPLSSKKINYNHEDYKEGLSKAIKSDKVDIDKIVEENLTLLGSINDE